MGSSGSGSLSVLSGGFPSSNQPLMFKFIERKKWTKLRKILARKAGTDRCTERDESGLSLLGMAFGFEAPLDIIKSILEMDPTQADSRDSFGASPLHVACLNGASAEAVLYLLHKCQHLSSSMDKDRRIPLHHAAECLCRDEIEFKEGIQIINALVDVYPDSIHASDKLRDSPIDIVQLARYHARPDSKDSNRLAQLYLVMKDISVRVYKLNKDKSEAEGYTAHEMRKEDGSRFTNSTTSSSVASSFVTTFSNKETVRGMELSIMGNGDRAPAKQDNKQLTPGNGELDIPDNGKKTKSKLKFWKKKI